MLLTVVQVSREHRYSTPEAVPAPAAFHGGARAEATPSRLAAAVADWFPFTILPRLLDLLGTDAAAAQAARIAGVRKVLQAESAELDEGMAEAYQALVVPLMANYDAVLTPATSVGKNISPRFAAALDVAQISEIIEVVDASTFVRPIYAGNALATVQSKDKVKVITVRGTGFAAASAEGGTAAI